MRDIANSVIHRSAAVCHHSSAAKRIEIIDNNYEFVIVNYDGLPLVAEAIKRNEFDLVIADEATAVKNVQTKRWKTLKNIISPTTYLWMMTGTPAAQSPLDAYGLAKLVNPTGVPMFYGAWRDKVMNRLTQFKWAAKKDAAQTVHTALQPSIRYTKKECLDLPPVLTETRDIPMTSQQVRYYNLIKEKAFTNVAGETITAVNKAAEVNKLLQISAGAAYTDKHEVIEFDCAPRLRVLQEILDDTDRKVVVFTTYRHSGTTVLNYLTKESITALEINGATSIPKRREMIHKFQNEADPRVLIIQPQAGAHGVTLTAADTIVFWSPVPSVELYLQAIGRADRIGQDAEKVTVYHLASSSVERRLYTGLQNRLTAHNLLTDIFDEESKETL